MSGSTQESVIIDIWTVPPGRQDEMVNELRAAFEQFRLIDGFIEGGVLANGDDTKIASDAYETVWVTAPPRHSAPMQVSRGAF
jgi:hypothetical protein